MYEEVRKALEKVRLSLIADGGDVELLEVTPEGLVKVRLKGACSGCPMSTITLKMGIEESLKRDVPQIKSVEAVD